MRRASVTVGRVAAPAAEMYSLLRLSIFPKVSRSLSLRALAKRFHSLSSSSKA